MDVLTGDLRPDGGGSRGLTRAVLYDGPGQILTVEGERFWVRQRQRGGSLFEYDYNWLTGPNARYGFGLSGPVAHSDADHAVAILEFLDGIDPATGYLA